MYRHIYHLFNNKHYLSKCVFIVKWIIGNTLQSMKFKWKYRHFHYSHPFSFVSCSFGLAGGNHYQEIAIHILSLVYSCWVVIANCGLITVQGITVVNSSVWYKTKFSSQMFGYQLWCLFCNTMYNYIYNVFNNMFNVGLMVMWQSIVAAGFPIIEIYELWQIWRATDFGGFSRKLTCRAWTN